MKTEDSAWKKKHKLEKSLHQVFLKKKKKENYEMQSNVKELSWSPHLSSSIPGAAPEIPLLFLFFLHLPG